MPDAGLNVLLLDALLRHESHAWLADRDGYRLCIVAIVLLPPPEWFDVLRRDDPDLVAKRLELSLPEEGADAGFDADHTGRDLTHGFEQSVPSHASAQ